jgi:hypothetical protein
MLTSRLRQAKQTCEDVRNMFHERYLSSLVNLSK